MFECVICGGGRGGGRIIVYYRLLRLLANQQFCFLDMSGKFLIDILYGLKMSLKIYVFKREQIKLICECTS